MTTNIAEEHRHVFEAVKSGVPALRRRPDISVPPECRELIRRGALVAVNSSGGKDSQAMTILLSRIVSREQLLVVHACCFAHYLTAHFPDYFGR